MWSRSTLQNYTEQYKRDQDRKRIQAAVDVIIAQILEFAAAKPNGEQKLQLWFRQKPLHIIRPEQYSELISTLKVHFPDTDILMDPMQTYLLVDWSEKN